MTRLLFYSLLVLGALLSLMTQTALAQHQISGRILDQADQAVPFSNVLLLTASDSSLVKGTITDTTGAYTLSQVQAGTYLLSAQMVGYSPYFSEPMQVDNDRQMGNIRMSESTTQLGEVVVKATKPMLEVTPNALVVNVESSPILQNGTAQEVLAKSPGVNVDQDGNISVKGKSNVLVYLDGKPTYLSDRDLTQLLESTPAQNIAKIEIMDNPPARYDAAGNAGIINIIRKKSADLGLNGSVGMNMGYGKFPKLNPSLNLNYRNKNVNLFGNYSHYYARRFQINDIFRSLPFRESVTTFDQFSYMEHRTNSDNFRAGADWFLSPKSTLGALVTGNLGNWNGERENTTKLGGLYENPYDGLNADNRSRNTWQNLTYNLNFHRDLGEGSSLSLDADYAQWQRRNRQAVDNRYFSNEGNTTEADLLVRTLTETNIDILALQADYNRNIFGDWALEAGVKSSLVQTDNDLDFSTIEEEVKVTDTLRSNRFQYDENINAAYINISKKFNEKWQMQTGLRAEHTDSHGYSVTLDSTVQQNYLNFFPSASLSYTVKDKHSLSASYSRRVDRPNYQNLNPFEYFLDRFTFERGNPFLNPQFTDAYGLTYGFRNAAFLTLNYNVTRDAITQVLLQEASEQITYQTTVNLDRQRNYSANLAAPLPLAQWWTLNLNLTGFLNTIDSEFSEGGMVNKSRWSYNLRAQHTFTLPGDLKLELMGWYSSPQLWGIFNIQEQYQIDMGVSKTFGKLRVQASLDDVFNIRENRVEMMQGDIDTQIFNRWESRVFRLNLSYRFGNDKVKRSRRRGTASDDLRQRAND